MDLVTTFNSNNESLQDILKTLADGRCQLPEFQRGWVWDDPHIVSLLASVSLSYPIGAVMILENGNPDVRFKPRPVEGVNLDHEREPDRFILDGQQRLTSLFQTLYLKSVVKTRDHRKKKVSRWYYIDMRKALNPGADREDAILSIPEDRKIKNFRNEIVTDYSGPGAEYEHMIFPVSAVFNSSDWRAEFNKHWKYTEDKIKLFDQFEKEIIKRFEQYQVPVIKLLKGTPKVAVCQVFEKVNTGGVSLSVFELVTATFAADGFNLREDWEGNTDSRGKKIAPGRKDCLHQHRVLGSVGADELLQVITLLSTNARKLTQPETAISCKRDDILKLSLKEFQKWVEPATDGFVKAAKFLFEQKIFTNRDLPYTTQIVPLAAIHTILGESLKNDTARAKLARWYWCGVFGELYSSSVETRFARDIAELQSWIVGGNEPSTVVDCNVAPSRLDILRSRNSAAYKGLFTLLMRDGCLDFRSGVPYEVENYFGESVDIHHIFPKAWCERRGIDRKQYDYESIINKTALSYQTNRIIGGNAPSLYLSRLREKEKIDATRQTEILNTHVIDVQALSDDNFKKFYDSRREALLTRIEAATGKPILRQSIIDTDDNGYDFDADTEEI